MENVVCGIVLRMTPGHGSVMKKRKDVARSMNSVTGENLVDPMVDRTEVKNLHTRRENLFTIMVAKTGVDGNREKHVTMPTRPNMAGTANIIKRPNGPLALAAFG